LKKEEKQKEHKEQKLIEEAGNKVDILKKKQKTKTR